MKKIFNILLVAAVVAGMASCTKVKEEDAFSKAPVAPELYAHNDILITTNTLDEDVTFSWSAYRFLPEGLEYSLYASYTEEAVLLAQTKERFVTWSKSDFRELIYEKIPELPENDIFSLLLNVSVPNNGKELKSSSIRVTVYAAGDAAAPVVQEVMENKDLDPSDPLESITVLSWEPARLVYGEAITYDVMLSLADLATKADDEDADEPKQVKLNKEPIEGTELVVTADDLNEAIVEAGGVEMAENDVVFEVIAYCKSLPNGVSSVSSDPVSITTYKATFAPELLISGNIKSTSIPQSSVVKGFYQGIVDLTTADGSDAEILFCPSDDPEGAFGGKLVVSEKASGDYAAANGNVGGEEKAKVPSGLYYIELNQKLNTASMVQFETLSLIGAAVGDYAWGQDVDLEYNAEKRQFSAVTELKAGEFKMRFNHNWNMSLGGSAEEGYTLSGGNIANEKEGEYRVVVDASKAPFVVKYINTSFPEQVYVPGSHNGWDHSKTFFAGNGEGQFEGFANLGGEWGFKLTPIASWDQGEWGLVKGSEPTPELNDKQEETGAMIYQLTSSDAGNILEGSEVTYYKAVVDLTELQVKLTPVTSVGIIGGFIGNSWTSDMYPMEYNASKDCWVATEVELIKGTEWKFRMNEAWTINLGGALDNLTQDGSNIVEANGGIYDIALYINTTPYHAEIVKTGESTFVDTSEGPWSLIGEIGESNWDTDFDMEKSGHKFTYKGLKLSADKGFKIRYGHEWSFNRGASAEGDGNFTVTLGEAFAVSNNGRNMQVAADGEYDITYDADKETILIVEAGSVVSDQWSLIGINGDWTTDVDMAEVAPGIFVSPVVEITTEGWKIRKDHDWAVNRGTADLNTAGEFLGVVQDGGNIPLTGKFHVVYNANIDAVGTLVWGVVGSIASISDFNWNNDIPLNLGSDGKWYSITPITFTSADTFKIRKDGDWAVNVGGAFSSAENAFAVTQDGANITGVEGTYMVVYDPASQTVTLTSEFWGIVGDFNSWGNDVFMMCTGNGLWYAGGMTTTDGWKLRKGAAWDVNRGGTFVEAGTPFAVEHNGSNIAVSGVTTYQVVYDSVNDVITVK